jgi:Tfp pilus assembly protein PilZ
VNYEQVRKHRRVGLQTQLWIGQDGIFTRTDEHLRDLSVGGAFVESRQVFPIGSVVNLRFSLPVSTQLATCTAIVRNVQPGEGFGVEFLDLSEGNLKLVERYIAGVLAAME